MSESIIWLPCNWGLNDMSSPWPKWSLERNGMSSPNFVRLVVQPCHRTSSGDGSTASPSETQSHGKQPCKSHGIDWCCFYDFVRNSLVVLLEALCARIFSWDSWISVFPDFLFWCVCNVSNKALLPPLSTRLLCLVVAIPLVCWLYICAYCTCVLVRVCLCMCMWKCVGKVINI